jgi:hypothetical protein
VSLAGVNKGKVRPSLASRPLPLNAAEWFAVPQHSGLLLPAARLALLTLPACRAQSPQPLSWAAPLSYFMAPFWDPNNSHIFRVWRNALRPDKWVNLSF